MYIIVYIIIYEFIFIFRYILLIDLFIYFFCENMLFFKLIYLYNVDMRKKHCCHLHRVRIVDCGPSPFQPRSATPYKNYASKTWLLNWPAKHHSWITSPSKQNWRLEEQITSNLKPDSRTRPKPWLHANFTFSFFSFFSWRLNPVDVHDLTLSIFNIIGSQEKAIQYFHLGYCLAFFSETCRFYLDQIDKK